MNTSELNKVLSDEIYKLRAGKVKIERVNAVSRAAGQIVAAARLELSYMRVTGERPKQRPTFFTQMHPAQIESRKKQ